MILAEQWEGQRDGPLTETALRKKLEGQGYRVVRYVYPPGTHFGDHTHPVPKKDAVVSGRLQITMGTERVILGAGDSLEVPAGVVHSADVVGDDEVVSLDGTKRE